jgi:hypothetical protein
MTRKQVGFIYKGFFNHAMINVCPSQKEGKLFYFFDHEHFDGHIGGNQFEAKLVEKDLL